MIPSNKSVLTTTNESNLHEQVTRITDATKLNSLYFRGTNIKSHLELV